MVSAEVAVNTIFYLIPQVTYFILIEETVETGRTGVFGEGSFYGTNVLGIERWRDNKKIKRRSGSQTGREL